jgi:aspartyl-tRNA(Asn)/glutamyl-tRNA(Gln) amidotransferase subunit B
MRQSEMLDEGKTICQETRGWNDDHGESYLMRTKESANDYRYFPDPDLMPVVFSEEELEELRGTLPELPAAMRRRFVEDYAVSEYDAGVLTGSVSLSAYFDSAAKAAKNPKMVSNWITTELLRLLGEEKIELEDCKIAPEQLAALTDMIVDGAINGKIGKEVFAEMFAEGKDPKAIVEAKGLAQVSDSGAIGEVVAQALAANPKQVAEYKSGNEKVIQFLMGQVMRLSRGKANPQLVMSELKKQLAE